MWNIFQSYTGRYARLCFLYLPLPLLLVFLGLDYLPGWRTHDLSKMFMGALAIIFFSVTTVFVLFTVIRFFIALSGSLQAHQKTQSAWFHLIVQSLCYVVIIAYLQYLRPILDPNVLSFSREFPNTFIALPLLALTIYFLLYGQYFANAYRQTHRTMLEAQYNTLKSQLQPHFLFNSINSLVELIDTDSDRARDMAQKLADLYREILANSKAPTSTLRSEISIVQNYLDLSKVRFGERVSFSLKVPEDAEGIFIPSLILQTLVENCVKHGIAKSTDPCYIRLEVWKDADLYRFRLTNSGEPYSSTAKMGTGLTNTMERLKLLAGERHNFRIAAFPNGTVVEFSVPELRHG